MITERGAGNPIYQWLPRNLWPEGGWPLWDKLDLEYWMRENIRDEFGRWFGEGKGAALWRSLRRIHISIEE